METTFGLPRYQFPPTEKVIEQIVAFCRDGLEDGEVPVLLGYSLGKAQEILCSLDGAGLTPMLHGSVYQMTRIYEQFGQSFCKYVRYNKNDVAGKVLICPPSASHSPMIEKIPRRRVAIVSGWAVEPNAVYRYQVDAAFPLSDHADYNDLIRYVDLVKPKRVLTLHGFAAEFARDLRNLQVGWSVIVRALRGATKVGEGEFYRIAAGHGDLGKTAFEVLEGRTTPKPFTIVESRKLFDQLHRARGPIVKIQLLQARF